METFCHFHTDSLKESKQTASLSLSEKEFLRMHGWVTATRQLIP